MLVGWAVDLLETLDGVVPLERTFYMLHSVQYYLQFVSLFSSTNGCTWLSRTISGSTFFVSITIPNSKYSRSLCVELNFLCVYFLVFANDFHIAAEELLCRASHLNSNLLTHNSRSGCYSSFGVLILINFANPFEHCCRKVIL